MFIFFNFGVTSAVEPTERHRVCFEHTPMQDHHVTSHSVAAFSASDAAAELQLALQSYPAGSHRTNFQALAAKQRPGRLKWWALGGTDRSWRIPAAVAEATKGRAKVAAAAAVPLKESFLVIILAPDRKTLHRTRSLRAGAWAPL